MTLNLDEHTGEAGLITRLEAFIDMIQWRGRALWFWLLLSSSKGYFK